MSLGSLWKMCDVSSNSSSAVHRKQKESTIHRAIPSTCCHFFIVYINNIVDWARWNKLGTEMRMFSLSFSLRFLISFFHSCLRPVCSSPLGFFWSGQFSKHTLLCLNIFLSRISVRAVSVIFWVNQSNCPIFWDFLHLPNLFNDWLFLLLLWFQLILKFLQHFFMITFLPFLVL